MIDINDVRLYKPCHKKQYEVYICRPPKNTVVINKLEQFETAHYFGRTYFTVAELRVLKQSNPNVFDTLRGAINQGRAYVVTDNTPIVVSGTIGELYTITDTKFVQTFVSTDGATLSPTSLSSDWRKAKTRANLVTHFCLHIPKDQYYEIRTPQGRVLAVNGRGISHGRGDFILASAMGNQPNLNDRWVVNGSVFGRTYDNRGFTEYLDKRIIGARLPIPKNLI